MKKLAAAVFALLIVSCAQAQSQAQRSPAASPQGRDPGASPAGSSAAGTATGVDPAKEADIRHLLEITGAKSLTSQIMAGMKDNLKPVLTNSLPPGDYRAKLIDLFFDKFMARANAEFPKLLDAAVPIYDKYLSAEDIKGMIQFYQTPLGQKTLSVLPQITAAMQSQGQKLGEQIGRESMLEVLSEHPDLAKAMEDARTGAGR